MASPATIGDLVARSLRPLSDQEQAVGAVMLEDAWALMVAQRPHVAARVATDPAFEAVVKQILCAMVLRVLRNPDGKLSERIDDYEYRRDSVTSTGVLSLTDAELDLLGLGDAESDGAWTIRATAGVGRGYWASTDLWVPLP